MNAGHMGVDRAGANAMGMAGPEGLEPSTLDLEGPCSIQLSYGPAPRQSWRRTAAESTVQSEPFRTRVMKTLFGSGR